MSEKEESSDVIRLAHGAGRVLQEKPVDFIIKDMMFNIMLYVIKKLLLSKLCI